MGCATSTPALEHGPCLLDRMVAESATFGATKSETPKDDSFFAKYQLGVKLGKGGFAQVREVKATNDDSIRAVKIVDLRAAGRNSARWTSSQYREDAVREAGTWRAAGQHANIVHLQDAYLEHGACFFVMELCDQHFYAFLASGAGCAALNDSALASVFSHVVQGCAHIHGLGVVHRDLKPDNLITSKGVVKICDFGLAACLPATRGLSGTYGTAPFMAPEMLNSQRYEAEVDIWSLGVIAYVLFYGIFPYMPEKQNASEMKRAIREGKRPSFMPSPRLSGPGGPVPSLVSAAAKRFAESMLNRDPTERVTAAALLRDPYLQDTRFSASRPPLAAVLACAVREGAFENRRVDAVDKGLDPLLSELHLRFTGEQLEHVAAPLKASESLSESMTTTPSKESQTATASGATSGMSSGANSPTARLSVDRRFGGPQMLVMAPLPPRTDGASFPDADENLVSV